MFLVRNFVFIGFLGLLSLDAQAKETLNSICEDARVAALGKSPEYKNYCTTPEAELSKKSISLLTQIRDLNQKAAQLFGVSTKDLFAGEYISVSLDPKAASSLESVAIGPTILMGVPQDWSEQPINESVYLHELGHVIVSLHGSALPESFRDLHDTSLFICKPRLQR